MAWDPNQRPLNNEQSPQTDYDNPETYYRTPQQPFQQPFNEQREFYSMPSNPDPGYQQGTGYSPPAKPLPLEKAIRELPNHYLKVLSRPSALFFAEEKGKASWSIVLVQLIGWTLIATIFGILVNTITPLNITNLQTITIGSSSNSATLSTGTLQIINDVRLAYSYGLIILIPLFFFIWTGLMFLIARAFGGEGTFLAQCYTTLLFQVPLGILSSLLGLVPFLGLLSIGLYIYGIVLQVYATMGIHRLPGGKATASIFLLFGVLLLILCPLSVAFALFISLTLLR